LLVLMALAMLFGSEDTAKKQGTSYDASSKGFRAAYLLLEDLGYPVARSRRLSAGTVRLVLQPSTGLKDTGAVDDWVKRGGILVLADTSGDFAKDIGVDLKKTTEESESDELAASDHGITTLSPGKTRIEWPGHPGRVWARAGDSAVLTIYERGRGEIWLLNMPELFDNNHLKKADNAILLARVADEALERRPGSVSFDEYFHGLRDRPSITELLFQPPTLWITLHGILILGLVIWHFAPRFGAFRPERRIRRRSKEEFLDAMASLLERKGDYPAAYRAVRDDLLRSIEAAFGLPPGTRPEELVRIAALYRGKEIESLLKPITNSLPDGAGKVAFLHAVNELETTRERFFDRRRGR